jgi:cytochrome c oxidase subunit 2
MTSWHWLPRLASEHGASLDRTLGLVHVLMAVLFVGWGAFFAYALVRFRRRRNPVADYRGVTSHASTWLEAAVAVVEALLLVGLSMPLWADRVEHLPPPAESTRVRVVAEQFAWNVHYPGPDGVFGRTDPRKIDAQSNPLGLDRDDPAAKDDVTTINQLHLPVGRPARITLTSKDVIHSFALQEMRVKQDVIPGISVEVWFVPKVTTEELRASTGNPERNYEISCAQLCGLGHYRMRGYLTIDSPEGFQKWMDEEQAQLAAESGEESVWK